MKRSWMMPTLMVALAFPSISFGVVDMKNSNYSESFLDIALPGTGYALKVQRFYNSRSNFNGIFGYGWCSDFETTLEKNPEGRLKLVECGAGQEIIYAPAKFQKADLDKLISTLIAFYKKATPNATAASIETLQTQLLEDADIRSRWAKQAGVPIPELRRGTVYSAENLEVEQITFDGASYIRLLSDGTSQKFDQTGHLSYLYDKNANFLKLTYNTGETLREVIDNTGKKLVFSFVGKRVKEITGPNNLKVEYKYKGEDVTEVKNMWKNTYTYEYDDTHNLTKIQYPDNTFKALTYNKNMDWVTSFTERAVGGVSCTETYKYEMDKASPRDHFWSTAIKKCGNEIKNEARFEFWHKTRADGRKYLARVLSKSLTDTLDVTYHPEFGRPIAIKKGSVTTQFDYYANGLIWHKSTANSKMAYEYKNTFNKVSKVLTEFFDPKGKKIKERATDFAYDTKANLVSAKNTDGQSVVLTYDGRGRIATIIDQAKKEVMIKYDEKTGKPASISRPKLGAINVSYKPSGEINQVKSDDGPTVAVQIASTFNNLLDIIAPATSDLNL
jgi:YD repeat-containing protein